MVPWVGQQFVIVLFPDHTHLLIEKRNINGISRKFYINCVCNKKPFPTGGQLV